MAEDATEQVGASPEAESTEGSSEQKGTDSADLIASYRKRQAGAEAARQAAEKKLSEAETELAALRAKHQTATDKELTELATLQERLTQSELRAEQAEANAQAKILDARFPNARKELPEVTDEVRLAKFEAMLREDDEDTSPPVPRGVNPPKDGNPAAPKEKSSKDLLATLKTMQVPW